MQKTVLLILLACPFFSTYARDEVFPPMDPRNYSEVCGKKGGSFSAIEKLNCRFLICETSAGTEYATDESAVPNCSDADMNAMIARHRSSPKPGTALLVIGEKSVEASAGECTAMSNSYKGYPVEKEFSNSLPYRNLYFSLGAQSVIFQQMKDELLQSRLTGGYPWNGSIYSEGNCPVFKKEGLSIRFESSNSSMLWPNHLTFAEDEGGSLVSEHNGRKVTLHLNENGQTDDCGPVYTLTLDGPGGVTCTYENIPVDGLHFVDAYRGVGPLLYGIESSTPPAGPAPAALTSPASYE